MKSLSPIPIALVLLMALALSGAEPAPVAEPPKKFDLAAIDAYLTAQVRERGYPGLSLTIVRDGKIIHARGYGLRSLEDKLPVEPDTAFWIGSVTKQFACACIFLLAQEGKLSVEDRVAKYYPGLTRAKDVTLYDLMTHTSGYPDYYPLDFVDRRLSKPVSVDKAIEEYAGGKLDFEPGRRWSYSNTGYLILGKVVEKVSGDPFGTFLTRRILKPLGMDHSAYEPAANGKRLALGYTSFALGPAETATPEANGWLSAAGGLTASGPDLARWDLALMEGKVLRPDSFRLMSTPRRLSSGKTKDYGCGLGIYDRGGEKVLMHSGGVSGFLSYNAMIPRTKSAVILLCNSDHLDPAGLHRSILTLLLKDQAEREGPDIPKVAGPAAKETALAFLRQMQAGKVDRSALGEEFSLYLTEERLKAAAPRLKALGEPVKAEVDSTNERGGMEVAHVRITFAKAVLKGALYRTPDGKIQQLLFSKE
jgi:CubicO group peptidase (beta-lactamase class C family)